MRRKSRGCDGVELHVSNQRCNEYIKKGSLARDIASLRIRASSLMSTVLGSCPKGGSMYIEKEGAPTRSHLL